MIRVLLDTNILIHREGSLPVPEGLQALLQLLASRGVVVVVHPLSIAEIGRDSDIGRRQISLSKVGVYPPLEHPPDYRSNQSFLEAVGSTVNPRDEVDNALLYSVARDAVSFLVSEDRGLHSKANRLGLRNRVLSIDEACTVFRAEQSVEAVASLPALQNLPAHNLAVDDPFFASLERNYPGFRKWWTKVCREGRRCWVHFHKNGSIGALLMYKEEEEEMESTPPLPFRRRLKISTLKVDDVGQKIGELFIRLAVDYCVSNAIDEIYLTHFTQHGSDLLVDLIRDYGFMKVGMKRTGNRQEDVYWKALVPPPALRNLAPVEISRTYYPGFYDGQRVKKFIVPIRPQYHNRLFTDQSLRQTALLEFEGGFVIEGNTIDKAYLSHSGITTVDPGDLLLFYRSHDYRQVTSLGVVYSTAITKDPDRIQSLVGKRTVYTRQEIEEMAEKPTLVILFRYHFRLPSPIGFDALREDGVVSIAPQTITEIGHPKYLRVRRRSGLDVRYIVSQA